MSLPAVVSLFSGGGGLDLGFTLAGFSVAYAADISEAAVLTHQRNFPDATATCCDLAKTEPGQLLQQLNAVLEPGHQIGVIGGPPCQGFSRANVRSRSDDPRNNLPSRYVDLIRGLQTQYDVRFLLFENVLGIRDVKHRPTLDRMMRRLNRAGFKCRLDEYSSLDYGVPQTRRRIIVLGFKDRVDRDRFTLPAKVGGIATVREAIGGLPEPAFFSRSLLPTQIPHHQNHWTMQPKSPKFTDPTTLNGNGRSFRRLEWDSPSPTVAYGNREVHVHPNGTRRLSVYEAMRIQGFPSEFVLQGTLSQQVEQVSNAVPPPLARHLALSIRKALDGQQGGNA